MTTTTISEGYLYITNTPTDDIADDSNTFTDTGYTVAKVALTAKVSHNIVNTKATKIPLPAFDGDIPESGFVDVKMIEESLTAQGELHSMARSGDGFVNDTDSALEKLNNIRTLMRTSTSVTFVWGVYNATKTMRQKYTGTILKIDGTEDTTSWHKWTSVNVVKRIPIIVQLYVGSSFV